MRGGDLIVWGFLLCACLGTRRPVSVFPSTSDTNTLRGTVCVCVCRYTIKDLKQKNLICDIDSMLASHHNPSAQWERTETVSWQQPIGDQIQLKDLSIVAGGMELGKTTPHSSNQDLP